MVYHPRDPAHRSVSRRDFLRRSLAAGVALPSAAAILAACASDDDPGPGTDNDGDGVDFSLTPTPDSPVKYPIYDDNPAIESGLEPETNTTFKIFNWIDYLWPKKLRQFGEMHGVEVEYTTFYNMETAIERMRTGELDVDVFFPVIDYLPRMVAAKLLQPLNRSYMPNMSNLWSSIQSPFYDQESQYSVPYTVYTTGVEYLVPEVAKVPEDYSNPYDILWDPANAGKVGLYDEYREVFAMTLLRNGVDDINTADEAAIEQAKQDIIELIGATDARLTINGAYAKLPAGAFHVHQAWSGDVVAAQYYGANGYKAKDLGFYFPPSGGGVIGNDLMAIPTTAKNPVLAHMFLDYMLDDKVGLDNFGWVGYQPPLTSIEPTSLIADGWVRENIESAVVTEEQFGVNKQILALDPEVDAIYLDAWEEITSGAG
jgi:spermidine/putrescine transport system substrate-binding protein